MAEFDVVEIFTSINGEGTRAGQLAVFVRFKGCNLHCGYCDTRWANEEHAPCQRMSETELTDEILRTNVRNVTLTGGEPLLQKDIKVLLDRLAQESSLEVEIETNGSVPISDYAGMMRRPLMTMDYKLPSSGMEAQMCLDNFSYLKPEDTVKFVCGSREDLLRAKEIMDRYELAGRCHIYLSPVFGQLNPQEMVLFMKEKCLNGVNLQLQLHKFIWNPEERGV